MEELLNTATELVALLPPSRIEALANRFRKLAAAPGDKFVLQLVTTPTARAALEHLLINWQRTGIAGDVLAGILLGAANAQQKALSENNIELVWTGPTTPFVATRRTEQVLLDLIRHAQIDIFIVSFVAYDISSIVNELNVAVQRNVEVRILLETSVGHGGSLSIDPVATMRKCIPSAALYIWTDRAEPFIDGRVHAKVAVADGNTAFLTSANLTGHALEKNMEAGVIIKGGQIPNGLRSHLHALVETKIIRQVHPQ